MLRLLFRNGGEENEGVIQLAPYGGERIFPNHLINVGEIVGRGFGRRGASDHWDIVPAKQLLVVGRWFSLETHCTILRSMIRNHKLIVLVLSFMGSASVLCKAGLPINTDVVKKGVVFIFSAKPDGSPDTDRPLGTGFLVLVPKKAALSPDDGFIFLVTARHIVDPDWVFCGPNPARVYLRFNKTGYDPDKDESGVEYLPVDLRVNGRATYRVSSDDSVDAAVLLLNASKIPQSKFDFLPSRLSDFATPEEIEKLGIGDSVLSAGLLPGVTATKRNYPVFKFGHIANILNEPMWTGCSGMPPLRRERVWLIAVNLVPGNSGSPVVYFPNGAQGVVIGSAIMRPVLIGIQSSSLPGSDIAEMTPVEDLFRIIASSGLQLDLFRGERPNPPPAH